MRRALFLGLSVLALGGGACASSDELDNDDGTSSSSGGRRSSSSSGGEEDATVSSSSGGFGGSSSSGGSSSGESSSSGGSSSGDADDAAVGEDAGDQDAALDAGAADAASDASADGGDASVDAGEDAAVDAGPDAEVDAGEPQGPCAPGAAVLRINEVQVAGVNSADEFVEIFNAGNCTATLTNFRLVYRSSNGNADTGTLFAGSAAELAPGGFFVVAHARFVGEADARFGTQSANDGGQLSGSAAGLAIRDVTGGGAGVVVDSMAYGSATNAYRKVQASFAPVAGKSVARTPDGHNTDHNRNDFPVKDAPTPGATNGN